jgi:hypothetical protein
MCVNVNTSVVASASNPEVAAPRVDTLTRGGKPVPWARTSARPSPVTSATTNASEPRDLR